MRVGLQDGALFGDQSLPGIKGFQAISLGWDHVAEHEWGIEKLQTLFGCKTKKLGFKGLKVNRLPATMTAVETEVSYRGETFPVFVLSTSERFSTDLKCVVDYMQHTFHDLDLGLDFWTAWDGSDFVLILRNSLQSDQDPGFQIFNLLKTSFEKKDIALFTSGKRNPFAGTGLIIAIYSRIPKESQTEAEKASIRKNLLAKRMAESKAIRAREAKIAEWKAAHPGADDTPWDACFLGEPTPNGLGLKFWLNPDHQSHLNANWITEKDVMDWVEGKPGAVIKSKELWDELNWMCSGVSYRTSLIGYNLHKFNRHPAQWKRPKGDGYYEKDHYGEDKYWYDGENMPKKALTKDKKLTPEFIKYVEQHVKAICIQDIRDQFEYSHRRDLSKLNSITHIRKEADDTLYGFFSALRLMGYETNRGACNTPAVRENFSWWRDLLIEESFWEFYIELGVAYEPWVKNGYAEFTKNNFLRYRKNGYKDQELDYAGLDDQIDTTQEPAGED